MLDALPTPLLHLFFLIYFFSPFYFNKKKQVSDIQYLVLAQEPPVVFNCIMGSIYFMICLGNSINLLPCFMGKYILNSYLRYLR